jgi:hypothetical protein
MFNCPSSLTKNEWHHFHFSLILRQELDECTDRDQAFEQAFYSLNYFWNEMNH